MRNHPIVNGKPTTFPALAKKLGIGKDGARARYNRAAANGPVTLSALRAIDQLRARREKRDQRIVRERQTMRRSLVSVAARVGNTITVQRVQRVQQIAGRLS